MGLTINELNVFCGRVSELSAKTNVFNVRYHTLCIIWKRPDEQKSVHTAFQITYLTQ